MSKKNFSRSALSKSASSRSAFSRHPSSSVRVKLCFVEHSKFSSCWALVIWSAAGQGSQTTAWCVIEYFSENVKKIERTYTSKLLYVNEELLSVPKWFINLMSDVQSCLKEGSEYEAMDIARCSVWGWGLELFYRPSLWHFLCYK